MMWKQKVKKRKMKQNTESNNQGHEEYFHESKNLVVYLITVINRNVSKLLSNLNYATYNIFYFIFIYYYLMFTNILSYSYD